MSSPTLTVRSVVQVGGADTRLQSVRIGPADIPGLLVIGPRADVTAEGVLIDLAVRDTEGHESYGLFGRGLDVESGATTSVTRALFERNRDVGVYASGVGTSVTLTDVVARDTQSQESDGAAGHGLNVQTGAAANVTRALFEGNRNIGVFVLNAGTSVTLTDVVVRDTQSQRSDRGGARPRHPGERDGGGHSRAL